MVALASPTTENSHRRASQRFKKPLSRVRGNSALGSHRDVACKSLNRIEMRLSIYESRNRLESFSRDPIKYKGGMNLYSSYMGLKKTDPKGTDADEVEVDPYSGPLSGTFNVPPGQCFLAFECVGSPAPGSHCGLRLGFRDSNNEWHDEHLHSKGIYAEGGRGNGCKVTKRTDEDEIDSYTITSPVLVPASACECILRNIESFNQFMGDNDNYQVFPRPGDSCGSKPGCNSNYATKCQMTKCGINHKPDRFWVPGWDHRMKKCKKHCETTGRGGTYCHCSEWENIDEDVCK